MIINILDITFPEWDKDLFVYLNSKHISWLDPVMYTISSYTFWVLSCIVAIALMIYVSPENGKRGSIFLLIGIAVNSVANNLVKLLIMRPRPGNESSINDMIRQLEDVGSTSSFFSAHSSNSFCLALFLTLYFRNKYIGVITFLWAIGIAYSRIYVGKHYPLDILFGIIFGLFTGWFAYYFYRKNLETRSNKLK